MSYYLYFIEILILIRYDVSVETIDAAQQPVPGFYNVTHVNNLFLAQSIILPTMNVFLRFDDPDTLNVRFGTISALTFSLFCLFQILILVL